MTMFTCITVLAAIFFGVWGVKEINKKLQFSFPEKWSKEIRFRCYKCGGENKTTIYPDSPPLVRGSDIIVLAHCRHCQEGSAELAVLVGKVGACVTAHFGKPTLCSVTVRKEALQRELGA